MILHAATVAEDGTMHTLCGAVPTPAIVFLEDVAPCFHCRQLASLAGIVL